MRKLRIHDAATLEALEAAIWYERERTGLGAEFGQAIDRALDVLEQDASRWQRCLEPQESVVQRGCFSSDFRML